MRSLPPSRLMPQLMLFLQLLIVLSEFIMDKLYLIMAEEDY